MPNRNESLIQCLTRQDFYPHSTASVKLIETHISWVFLTGDFVYKVKKPVDMGFLDFSTLEKRKHYCEEEVRLNQRLAPEYYLEVIPITGSPTNPEYAGNGEVIEYAVKMRQFPEGCELDKLAAKGLVTAKQLELVARKIAKFHLSVNVATESHSFGDLSHVHQPVVNCYRTLLDNIEDEDDLRRVKQLKTWTESNFKLLKPLLIARKENGYVRECHGDLHLRNIAIDQDKVIAFDCIEFNPDLRWNDVMSEIAFLVMDLDDHQQNALAITFLNQYLEITGDFAGLRVFTYYLVYRAIVRAMVSMLRATQKDVTASEQQKEIKSFRDYITLAKQYTVEKTPAIFLTVGFSGSGKSYFAKKIAPDLGAVHIRSDVERKRLHNVSLLAREGSGLQEGMYSSSSTERTYHRLAILAEHIIRSGFHVIVDATFLQRNYRELFFALAEELDCPIQILHCTASNEVLQERIEKRQQQNQDASDADLAVLKYQKDHFQAFQEEELEHVVSISTENRIDIDHLVNKIKSRITPAPVTQ